MNIDIKDETKEVILKKMIHFENVLKLLIEYHNKAVYANSLAYLRYISMWDVEMLSRIEQIYRNFQSVRILLESNLQVQSMIVARNSYESMMRYMLGAYLYKNQFNQKKENIGKLRFIFGSDYDIQKYLEELFRKQNWKKFIFERYKEDDECKDFETIISIGYDGFAELSKYVHPRECYD